MRYLSCLLPILFCCSTVPKTENNARSKISVINRTFVTSVLIYLPDQNVITESAFATYASEALKGFEKVSDFPDSITRDGFQVTISKRGDEDFILPDTAILLRSLKLTDYERRAFDKTEAILAVLFFGTKEGVIEKQKDINNFVHRVTNGKKVVIADLNTYEFYNPELWREKRVDTFKEDPVNISAHVTIHIYREEEFCRAVTLGMDKFCLPEISVKPFTCSNQNNFGNLINATIQILSENPQINNDSTLTINLKEIKNSTIREFLLAGSSDADSPVGEIKLKAVEPEEGDNYGPQFLISFENPAYISPLEEANAVMADIFGAEESYVQVQHDDEILEASEKAKLRLPELKKQFSEGLAPGYSILVKKAFETDAGGNEWMWVEVTKWIRADMEGVLQNDPFEISDLKAGAIIEFDESEVFDYILMKPDGSLEGNETGKVMERRDQ